MAFLNVPIRRILQILGVRKSCLRDGCSELRNCNAHRICNLSRFNETDCSLMKIGGRRTLLSTAVQYYLLTHSHRAHEQYSSFLSQVLLDIREHIKARLANIGCIVYVYSGSVHSIRDAIDQSFSSLEQSGILSLIEELGSRRIVIAKTLVEHVQCSIPNLLARA